MNYWEKVKELAHNGGKTDIERGEVIIREMLRLIGDLIDYRWAVEHYKGTGTAINDKKNSVKNSLALLISDLDIYTEQMGLTKKVQKRSDDRLEDLIKKKV